MATNTNPLAIEIQKRRINKEKNTTEINCPQSILLYNKYMGGVDKADQARACYSVGRPSKKWWKYLLHFVINVSIVNSYLIYKLTYESQGKPCKSHYEYRKNLVLQLINSFSSRKRSIIMNTSIGQEQHEIIKSSKKYCVLCREENRTTFSGRTVQTVFMCKQCGIALCKFGCFKNYHENI